LRRKAAASANALAVVTSNQQTAKEDRQAFQDATTERLNQMTDLMSSLNDAVVRLTTLQEEKAQ